MDFSVVFPLPALSDTGVSPVISVSPHHMVSLLLDLHMSHEYFRQYRAGKLCKISRYLPRIKLSSFPCASEADLAPAWRSAGCALALSQQAESFQVTGG